ncbi:hypothetical protein ABGB17_14710 [Sphaerisporangium sp. B11E5]|uniref:hypothetical protein n=1 Tax=Sphaerisporangium sp. B11E5 TaxID=3153563 RepID=UPI00325F8C68
MSVYTNTALGLAWTPTTPGSPDRRCTPALTVGTHPPPGTRGDAARLEAAATFAVVLLYQEDLCTLTGHHIDPDMVAALIARSLT